MDELDLSEPWQLDRLLAIDAAPGRRAELEIAPVWDLVTALFRIGLRDKEQMALEDYSTRNGQWQQRLIKQPETIIHYILDGLPAEMVRTTSPGTALRAALIEGGLSVLVIFQGETEARQVAKDQWKLLHFGGGITGGMIGSAGFCEGGHKECVTRITLPTLAFDPAEIEKFVNLLDGHNTKLPGVLNTDISAVSDQDIENLIRLTRGSDGSLMSEKNCNKYIRALHPSLRRERITTLDKKVFPNRRAGRKSGQTTRDLKVIKIAQ